MSAPWEEDTAEEAAEQREANRQALRKAIRNKQQQRSSRQALAQAEQQRAEEDAAGAAPGMAGGALGLDPSLLSKIDARTLQAMMKKAGIAAPNMPSGRKIRRAAQNMSPAQLAAMATAGAAAGLGK